MYTALNDAAVTVTISASDPTNPRLDTVYTAVQDSFYSGPNNQALVGVVTGTPAPSPVAPAAPANAEVLATVAVAASQSTVTNGNITNRISPATPIGQPVRVDTYAHLQLWSPLVAGTYADVNADTTALNGLYRWSGSVWTRAADDTGWVSLGSLNSGWSVVVAPFYRVKGGVLYLRGRLSCTATPGDAPFVTALPTTARPTTSFDGVAITTSASILNANMSTAGGLTIAHASNAVSDVILSTFPPVVVG
jgi:hypothetical protein